MGKRVRTVPAMTTVAGEHCYKFSEMGVGHSRSVRGYVLAALQIFTVRTIIFIEDSNNQQ